MGMSKVMPFAVGGVAHLDVSLFAFEYQTELQVLTLISWALVQVLWAHTNILFPAAPIHGISQVPGAMALSPTGGKC